MSWMVEYQKRSSLSTDPESVAPFDTPTDKLINMDAHSEVGELVGEGPLGRARGERRLPTIVMVRT